MFAFASRRVLGAWCCAIIGLCAVPVRADELLEWFMWHEIGKTVGEGVRSFNDYQAIRRDWDANIAAAKQKMKECGDCPEAKAELDKWQGVENDFNLLAGNAFAMTNVPPSVAAIFGIDVPLAPYRTPAERQAECNPSRPKWVNERSEFCQKKSDELVACLREYDATVGACTHDAAQAPGGACWEEQKFAGPCYAADYAAVEREQKAQDARAQGVVIPDVVDDGIYKVVAYGKVPDDYQPDMPPPEKVIGAIDGTNTTEVRFRMRKLREGAFDGAVVKPFAWNDVAWGSKCFEQDSPTDEIGLRICEDLWVGTSDPPHPLILKCDYVAPRRPFLYEGIYWYGERPAIEVFDPAYLLKRARDHPMLGVGDARNSCPATVEEARVVKVEYRGRLDALSGANPEVPASQPWRSERAAERQKYYSDKAAKEIEQAIAAFPFDGAYDSDIRGGFYNNLAGQQQHMDDWRHECSIKRTDAKTLQLDCIDRGKPFEAKGTIEGTVITVHWKDIDLTYTLGTCGSEPCLHGHDAQGLPRNTLIRKGDLMIADMAAMITRMPIEGAYDLELSNGKATARYRCQIKRDSHAIPNRFPTICLTEKAERYEADGIPEEKGKAHLTYGPFFPTWLPVGDKSAEMMDFPFNAAWSGGDSPALLEGRDRNGLVARLVRTGSEDTAWTGTDFFKGVGLPIEVMEDKLKSGEIRTLRHNKIVSVEQLAALTDEQTKFKVGGVVTRDQARRWLTAHGKPLPSAEAQAATATQSSGSGLVSELQPADTAQQAPSTTQQAALPSKPVAVEGPGRTGKWVGTLKCTDFPFQVILLAQDVDEDVFWGTFEFLATPPLPSPDDGMMLMYGWQYRGTDQIKIAVTKTTKYSLRLTVGNMDGKMTSTSMTLKVVRLGCENAVLTRVSVTPDGIGDMPDPTKRSLDYGRGQAAKGKPPKLDF